MLDIRMSMVSVAMMIRGSSISESIPDIKVSPSIYILSVN